MIYGRKSITMLTPLAPLALSAAATPDKICVDEEKCREFTRTTSRLIEMQSQGYLELQHQSEGETLHNHLNRDLI